MTTLPPDAAPPIAALASACARQIPSPPSTFEADADAFRPAFQTLLAAIAGSDPRFVFDRENRPAALQAVRNALPAMEGELFDVILEDIACELAATREAMYQLAVAATSRDGLSESR